MGLDRDPRCGEDVAPYALGALPDGAAREFERHLAECELCRSDLDSLQPAVDVLPLSVETVEPPPDLRKRIMGVVEDEARARRASERSRRERMFSFRPLPALAAACVLLVAGLGVGLALTGEELRTVPATEAPAGASVALELGEGRARLVVDDMPPPPMGRVYQVWLNRGDGTPEPTDALFEVRDGHAEVAVPDDLEGVESILVTHEPRGGSSLPTQTPAIAVPL
jgi:anti-sigma-K factor RskA